MRIRKYKNLTFELNTDKFKHLIQGTHWSRKEKMTRTKVFKNKSNSLNWVSKNLYQEKGNSGMC